MTPQEARKLLAKECFEAGGQSSWAEKHGVSPQYVNDAIHGRREIGELLASALGLRRVTTFVRALKP